MYKSTTDKQIHIGINKLYCGKVISASAENCIEETICCQYYQ